MFLYAADFHNCTLTSTWAGLSRLRHLLHAFFSSSCLEDAVDFQHHLKEVKEEKVYLYLLELINKICQSPTKIISIQLLGGLSTRHTSHRKYPSEIFPLPLLIPRQQHEWTSSEPPWAVLWIINQTESSMSFAWGLSDSHTLGIFLRLRL